MRSFSRFGMLAALWLAGCAAHTPPPPLAAPALPAQWAQASGGLDPVTQQWWQGFGSDELNTLVERAQAQSHDLAAAVARVQQAEAAARMASAGLWPQLTVGANASREARLGGQAVVDGNTFGLALQASYELDFWGRQRAGRDSAHATWQASGFARDTVRLSLKASVASAWLQTVALQERAELAERHVGIAERLLALVMARVRAGAAAQLDEAQQRGQLASRQAALADVRQQAAQARIAVQLLLGQHEAPAIRTRSLLMLGVPAVDAGVPSQLLSRRPDIARAEALLAAADADVTAARAALLPSLDLSASLGARNGQLRQVLDSPLYALAAALAAPIFDGGRLAAGRDQALARREELLATYRQAIVSALGDVEAALAALAGTRQQAEAHAQVLAQAQRALALAKHRYRAGADTLMTLLDAQRSLFAAQDEAVQLHARRLQASVALYRALGGG